MAIHKRVVTCPCGLNHQIAVTDDEAEASIRFDGPSDLLDYSAHVVKVRHTEYGDCENSTDDMGSFDPEKENTDHA